MTKKKETEIEPVNQGGELAVFSYGEDAGQGYQADSDKDQVVPRCSLIQKSSTIMDDDTVEGVKPGRILISLGKEVVDEVSFVIAATRKSYKKGPSFNDRSENSEYTSLTPTDPLVLKALATRQKGRIVLEDGDELTELQTLYCVRLDPSTKQATGQSFVLALASSALRSWRELNTRLRSFRLKGGGIPPIFAHGITMSTQQRTSDKGIYYVPNFQPIASDMRPSLIDPSGLAYQAAKELAKWVEDDRVSGEPEPEEKVTEEEIPF